MTRIHEMLRIRDSLIPCNGEHKQPFCITISASPSSRSVTRPSPQMLQGTSPQTHIEAQAGWTSRLLQ